MEVMWIVLPMALAISAIAVLVFIWAVRSGQFDDLVTPSLRILVDDDGPRSPSPCYAPPMSRPGPSIDTSL